ncbi:hypothetical protein SERLA73DRAFT_149150 [Serpula lacrymans var. lacrymans S7.3]|uniref:DDE-1 domain-containing protein n=1 Tax=Serpula lacrymans var. lacrymans (strain S7.3) TaxID=936435 RepID=F8PFV4_SERL3|nr:hypothetical protein SERLA73DRAFT_149150 [Serpula lacrymans var. lacrymans S7.3]
MTSFVQPLDAGIIRCFKAHYKCMFCLRTIELDEAGKDDIYKINLLKVMFMAQEAWASISADTIKNCWEHAFAMFDIAGKDLDDLTCDPAAWLIILKFTNSTISSLPEIKNLLHAHLGACFNFSQWKLAIDTVMAAVTAANELQQKALIPSENRTFPAVPMSHLLHPELSQVVSELMQIVVLSLVWRN